MRRRILLASAALPLLPRPLRAQGDARSAGRRALDAAAAGRWAEAETAARGADPAIAKVVTWLRLQQRGQASAGEIVTFLLANPDWPGQGNLTRRAEEALATDPDDALALRYFAAQPPRSLEGYQRLADALQRAGKANEATATLRNGWTDAPGDAAAEATYLSRNGGALSPAQHWARFDKLALARQTAAAARVVPLLDGERQALANARLAYGADQPDADAAAPLAGRDAVLATERARWLRRRDQDTEAAAAFAASPKPSPEVAKAAWAERNVLSRKLLRLGNPRTAYQVAAGHGIEEAGEARQEAEFLAGYLALQKLDDPPRAERHFAKVGEESRSVITRARSLYWQGRAAAYQNQLGRAKQRYLEAAQYPLAFYGQVASISLSEPPATLTQRIQQTSSPVASPAQQAAFERNELVGVVRALTDVGDYRRTRQFLLRLEELSHDPAEDLLVVRLAATTGRPDHPIWVVRRAAAGGLQARQEGWPTPWPAPSSSVEPALVYAIARQESNFDPEAVSSANARGLMQLLPATAQQVARRLSLAHQPNMLTSDPAHNMRLGAGYLEMLSERFGGAVPFMAAGYNAGPGRVDQWVGDFGDPRQGQIAMLDWMEQIPFTETRNYVQRVIENMAVYRAADPQAAALEHPMTAWLKAAK